MKELLEKALQNIQRMSQAQFAERLAAAKSSQLSMALRDFDELSAWNEGALRGIFSLKKILIFKDLGGFSEVNSSIFEAVDVICAANDERFALAA